MRSAIVYHLVSGHAWFSAGGIAALLLALELAGVFRTRPAPRVIARSLFLLTVGVAALSGTPVPLWLLVPLLVAIVAVIATGFRHDTPRAGRAWTAAALALVVAALALEAPHHRTPSISSMPSSIFVIGDSLSSGGFEEAAPWPDLLATRLGVPVTSYALPGDTTASALAQQAPELSAAGPGSLVLIEIGGNDLLGGGTAGAFESELSDLLATARSRAEHVVMFELPIPPGRWGWSAAQRAAAGRRGVPLIPKRVLARLVTVDALAGDGLHPTDAGHAFLAERVARLFPFRPDP